WPEPAQLMTGLQTVASAVAPPTLSQRLRKIDRRIVSGVAATLFGLVSVGWLASAASKPREVPKATLGSAHASPQRAPGAAAPQRLRVSEAHGGLVVEGLVDDGVQARATAQAMDAAAASFPLVRQVSVATDVAETIRSAVGLAGARVDYRGGGVFSFAV